MNMIRILDPDPDQHENLCGSETLVCHSGVIQALSARSSHVHKFAVQKRGWRKAVFWIRIHLNPDPDPVF